MTPEEFRKYGYQFVDWMSDYMDNVTDYPVKSQITPGTIYDQLQEGLPPQGEQLESIFEDFKSIILPGITHWQSPKFFAYFQANSSPPSILAEMLIATLGVQGMKWDTSPASTELEEKMMEWLGDAIGIPKNWSGVIQDSASSATLVSILTAREQKSAFAINNYGYEGFTKFRIYCSEESHSSIEKGAKIAGIGKENVVKIPTNESLELQTDQLHRQIEEDLNSGLEPLCIIAAVGTTGTLAIDPLNDIATIAEKFKIWLHVDAAYAGSALLLPEYKYLIRGIDKADSLVFNPHKWLLTTFDCSAYFIKDKEALINTFSISPEYLKSRTDGTVHNYCDWGPTLGRRFRSLKLWFVMRYYGLEGLQNMLRYHISLAKWFENQIISTAEFKLTVPRVLNLVCFQFIPPGKYSMIEINEVNEELVHQLNSTGAIYLTHTRVNGAFTLRMSIGQTHVKQMHMEEVWGLITKTAKKVIIQ